MGSTYYIEIEQQSRSSRHLHRLPHISSGKPSFSNSTAKFIHRNCTPRTLATCWELLFATFSSTITTAYTVHHEKRVVSSTTTDTPENALTRAIMAPDSGHFSFILDPPPALMLICCLVLGCSISSFAYRRQEDDAYQTPIFVLAITSATVFGVATGVSANIIMLGLIPWALCAAMAFSAMAHWLIRRCSRRTRVLVCQVDEKGVLIRH